MKTIILAFAFVASSFAFASTATVNPASPVIITSDFRSSLGEYIQAPWFHAEFTVNASEAITVTGVDIHVSTDKGFEQDFGYNLPMGGVEVAAGASYTLPLGYIYNVGPKDATVFHVTMKYNGWLGTKFNPTGRLNLSNTFVTQ